MRKIIIVDYNPQWPVMYEEARARLLNVIGSYTEQIEHIGSTSVPGLGAKPVIDILIGVRALEDADAHCIEPVVGLGYEYIQRYEVEMPFRRYFRQDNAEGIRTHHIHLVEITHSFWARHIVFRDYLRTFPDTAAAYEKLKRELAPQFTDGNEYANAKTDFIEATITKAFVWKKEQS